MPHGVRGRLANLRLNVAGGGVNIDDDTELRSFGDETAGDLRPVRPVERDGLHGQREELRADLQLHKAEKSAGLGTRVSHYSPLPKKAKHRTRGRKVGQLSAPGRQVASPTPKKGGPGIKAPDAAWRGAGRRTRYPVYGCSRPLLGAVGVRRC